MVTLNKPAAGSTNWFSDVDSNWTTIENGMNTARSIATGGTNATSFGTTDGVVRYDGTRLVNGANLRFDGTSVFIGGGTLFGTELFQTQKTSGDSIYLNWANSGTGVAWMHLLAGTGTTSVKYAYIRYTNYQTAIQQWDVGTYGGPEWMIYDVTAAKIRLTVDTGGSFVIGTNAALATNATAGFVYIPSCAGTPTGTPTSYTGRVAMVYDTTNNKLYFYNGGWKGATFA